MLAYLVAFYESEAAKYIYKHTEQRSSMSDAKKRGTLAREERVIHDLDASIEALEKELQDGYGCVLVWDEVASSTPDELARKEGRRAVLPRLISAARVKRLELLRAREERELPPLQENLTQTYESYQEAEEKLRDAQNGRNAALAAWNQALREKSRIEVRVKRIDGQITEIKGAT